MVICYFYDTNHIDAICRLFENQSVWMDQIHCILPIPVSSQGVASADPILYKHFNGIRCTELIDPLVKPGRDRITMNTFCRRVLGTLFLQLIGSVYNAQVMPLYL